MARVSTILSYHYRALTQLRLQDFDIRLENEPRAVTPIRRNLPCTQIVICLDLLRVTILTLFFLVNDL